MASSGRPRKACSTCKLQKIRCTEERPVCKRCARLKHPCIYSDDSARKLGKDRVSKDISNRESLVDRRISQARNERPSIGATWNASTSDQSLGIPSSLLYKLVDVYYENVYNATLLLHKQTFVESLEAGTVRQHIVLSVCAFAAKFYRDTAGQATLKEHGFMTDWARRAGKLVLQEAEELHEDSVVTYVNLALFWHAEGLWRLALLHKGNACQLLHTIGLGSRRLRTEPSFEAEIRRRRFWACYLMHCHLGEQTYPFEPWVMKKMALPWKEADFSKKALTGTQNYIENSDSYMDSTFEALARVITMWTKVSSTVRSTSSNSFHEQLSAIYSLDQDLTSWWSQLPDGLKMESTGTWTMDVDLLPKAFLANVFFHQSLCVLHSSLVPLFSWGRQIDLWPSALQLSAQTAYEHACEVSALLQKVLDGYPRLSAMPSFIAYAAYCGCAIQIPFISSADTSVREKAQRNVETNVKMIEMMSQYWRIASILRFYVGYLLRVHETSPSGMEGEPKHSTINTLTSFRTDAIRTRTSILEFMGILRRDGDGYVKSGDEIHLRVQDQNLSTEPSSRQSVVPNRANDALLASGGGDPTLHVSHSAGIIPDGALVSSSPSAGNNSSQPILLAGEQYRPELLSYLGVAGSDQLDLGIENQDYFNPFFDWQPMNAFNANMPADTADFNGCPLSLGYIYQQDNTGQGRSTL